MGVRDEKKTKVMDFPAGVNGKGGDVANVVEEGENVEPCTGLRYMGEMNDKNTNPMDIPSPISRYGKASDVGDAGEEGENLESCPAISYDGPNCIDELFIRRLLGRFVSSSYREPYLFNMNVMKRSCVQRLLSDVRAVLSMEQTLVDVVTPHMGQVRVFGDIHGDIHSLAEAMMLIGLPSEDNILVVAGDCVDRGSWGCEVFIYLFILKLWRPRCVYLIRGNHETTGATCRYGFRSEVMRKLGTKIFDAFMAVFRELPCAAIVRTLPQPKSQDIAVSPRSSRSPRSPQPRRSSRKSRQSDSTAPWYAKPCIPGERRIMVCHGGLFRAWTTQTRGSLQLGTLSDLARCRRQVDDPIYSCIEDVLWSDPQVSSPDVAKNHLRGAGILFGRGAVEAFFKRNSIHGLLRGHEGPDMREKRPEMNDMMCGYSIDIELVDGFVATVFTAADYPLDTPRGNKASFATLNGRGNGQMQYLPHFTQFSKRFTPTNFDLFYDPFTCRPATPRN